MRLLGVVLVRLVTLPVFTPFSNRCEGAGAHSGMVNHHKCTRTRTHELCCLVTALYRTCTPLSCGVLTSPTVTVNKRASTELEVVAVTVYALCAPCEHSVNTAAGYAAGL